jgi:hypothetical protein
VRVLWERPAATAVKAFAAHSRASENPELAARVCIRVDARDRSISAQQTLTLDQDRAYHRDLTVAIAPDAIFQGTLDRCLLRACPDPDAGLSACADRDGIPSNAPAPKSPDGPPAMPPFISGGAWPIRTVPTAATPIARLPI